MDVIDYCPVCGENVSIIGETADGRLIGSCKDTFTKRRWEECSYWEKENCECETPTKD